MVLVVKRIAFIEPLSHTLAHLLWWRSGLKSSLGNIITYIHSAGNPPRQTDFGHHLWTVVASFLYTLVLFKKKKKKGK